MSNKTLSLVSTVNFDEVTDASFSNVAVGDLFDEINTTLFEQLSSNNDQVVFDTLNTARGKSSSYEGVLSETEWDHGSVVDL